MQPDRRPGETSQHRPDYLGLVRFLLTPFLAKPDQLRLDCERSNQRYWIRAAFDRDDRAQAFGRGGRNIDAIRHTLKAVGQLVGDSVRLEIYGEHSGERSPRSSHARSGQPSDHYGEQPLRRASRPVPSRRSDRFPYRDGDSTTP